MVSAEPQPTSGKVQVAATEYARSAVAAPVSGAKVPESPRLEAVVAQLQQYLNSSQRNVEIRVDADTNMQVVTVRDAVSGDVIRQFPSEEVMRVIRNLREQQGVLLNDSA